MNGLKILVVILLAQPAWAFEALEKENDHWFIRCEMGQKGFEIGSLYNDHIRFYNADNYDELINNKEKKDKFIEDTRKMLEKVSICHPNIEFSFLIKLPSYNDIYNRFDVEKIQSHQRLVFKNTIYSALPAEFNIEIPEILLPETISMSKFNLNRFTQQCVGIFFDQESRAILDLSVNIQRISSGQYIATAQSGKIKTFCPKMGNTYKELVSFRYREANK